MRWYDVSAFYDTLAEIAQQTFSPKEIADQEPTHFLERYVSGLGSPAEIGPVAHLLAGAALPAPQFEALSAAYASALKQFSADGRSFSATISGQATAAAVEELAAACARKGINSLPVLDAWRSYLVRHLTGTVCADTLSAASAGMSFGMTAGSAANEQAYSGTAGAVRYFNENMRTGALPPISGDEAQPAKQEGQAHAAGLCASEECRRLGEQFGGLVLGPIGMAITSEQKSSGDWTAKLKDYLAALASWQSSADPAEGFLWKSRFYQYALGVAPDGQTRDMVLSAFLGWLQLNEYQREHPVEWFYPVNALIVRAFADPLAMKTTVRELRNSADPVIALYAELEQALPRPADRAAPLL